MCSYRPALTQRLDCYFFSCAIIPFAWVAILAVGRELHVAFELGDRFGQLALVQQRHAELIVRVGVRSGSP